MFCITNTDYHDLGIICNVSKCAANTEGGMLTSDMLQEGVRLEIWEIGRAWVLPGVSFNIKVFLRGFAVLLEYFLCRLTEKNTDSEIHLWARYIGDRELLPDIPILLFTKALDATATWGT